MLSFLKGRVNVVAKPGMRLEIPDGVVLQDKVIAMVTHLEWFSIEENKKPEISVCSKGSWLL